MKEEFVFALSNCEIADNYEWPISTPNHSIFYFLAQDVIYTSRAYATMSVSVCLSVCPSICDGSALTHYSQFEFQIPIQFTAHRGRGEG